MLGNRPGGFQNPSKIPKNIGSDLSYSGIYWKICWKFISPLFLLFIIILQMTEISEFTMGKVDKFLIPKKSRSDSKKSCDYNLKPVQYDGSVYTYPAWAHWTGLNFLDKNFVNLSIILTGQDESSRPPPCPAFPSGRSSLSSKQG